MWLQLCFLNLLQTSGCDCSDPSWHRNCYDAKMCITTCWLVPACCLPPSTELHSTASCMRLSFLSSPRWCSYGLGACVRKREEYEECCILLGHWCWAETPALVECKASTVFFNICTSRKQRATTTTDNNSLYQVLCTSHLATAKATFKARQCLWKS